MTYLTVLDLSTVTIVYCFYSTEVEIVLIYSVLIVGTTFTTSVMAGLTSGTTFSIVSMLFDVTIFVPSSVTVCCKTTGFLSVGFGRGEEVTYSVFPVLTSVTTVNVTFW